MKRRENLYPLPADEPIEKVEDIDLNLRYSYAHYLTWLFEGRVELIKGRVFRVAVPSSIHEQVFLKIFKKFRHFLKGQLCKVYAAPFDVRFPKKSNADEAVFTVLQPAICVVCDVTKLDEKGCIGAPDLVVELLSANNTKRALFKKFKIYEEFGVSEYWVVNLQQQTIHIYIHEAGKFRLHECSNGGTIITSVLLSGFSLKLDEVFANWGSAFKND